MALLPEPMFALSCMTVVSTFIAPVMTPVLMSVFAGSFIPIDTVAMMIGVINIIVIPVLAGLLAHSILYSHKLWANNAKYLAFIVFTSIVLTIAVVLVGNAIPGVGYPLRNGLVLGGVLIILVSLSKLIVSIWLGRPNTWIDRSLPLVSMAGICIILAVIIAQTHDVLMEAGALLVLAAVIHNSTGYLLGYWGARGTGIILGLLAYRSGIRKTSQTFVDEIN